MEKFILDKADKKVIYNGKKVISIYGGHIQLEDNSSLFDGQLAYEISDFWKTEIEKTCEKAPEVKFTLEECIDIAKSIYKGSYVSAKEAIEAIYNYKHLKPSAYLRSSYDPRDNDYADSTYEACIYEAAPCLDAFLQILYDNGYIHHTTTRTIYFRNIEPSYNTDNYVQFIKSWANGKKIDTELSEKIRNTCVATQKPFIAWHNNKFFPNATIDKLQELGWEKFYELNKDNIIKKREYFKNKEANSTETE